MDGSVLDRYSNMSKLSIPVVINQKLRKCWNNIFWRSIRQPNKWFELFPNAVYGIYFQMYSDTKVVNVNCNKFNAEM